MILGGTHESRSLALLLHAKRFNVVYSVARHGIENLPCTTLAKKYRNADELGDELQRLRVDLLVDTTHPYALEIKTQADLASQRQTIPLWRYIRRPWEPTQDDHWLVFNSIADILPDLQIYFKPFFSIGLQILPFIDQIPPHQFWFIRCLQQPSQGLRYEIHQQKGPFFLNFELELMQRLKIDMIVCKNSGGHYSFAKILVARQLKIPVMMQQRPVIRTQENFFDQLDDLYQAISNLKH